MTLWEGKMQLPWECGGHSASPCHSRGMAIAQLLMFCFHCTQLWVTGMPGLQCSTGVLVARVGPLSCHPSMPSCLTEETVCGSSVAA